MALERTVYVDESFFEWPGLANKEVNIAYGAISIPDRSIAGAKKRWKAFDTLVRALVLEDTGGTIPPNKEIKSSCTNKLKPASINTIGKFLSAFFTKHHIRSFGYFARAEGFVNNNLRNDSYDKTTDEFEEVIENQAALYSAWLIATEDRRNQMKDMGHGELGLLEHIIRPFVSCFLTHHLDVKYRMPFRIVWDHRSGEDEGLKDIVSNMVYMVAKNCGISPRELSRFYRGLEIRNSTQDVGLRFADVIAGAYRNLFRSYPELLTDNTSFEIKSAIYNAEMLSPTQPFYKRPMGAGLAESILSNSKEILFPHLIPSLGSGLFSYLTKYGDARSCQISKRSYFDMAD